MALARAHQAWHRFICSRWGVLRYGLELLLIVVWALVIGRVMLNRDPLTLNTGGDNVSAYGRFFWDHLKSCGTCALWSGQARGGNPVYIDPNADTFHPAVAIPALLLGTLQGFKATIVLCMIMGGLACWWLALELGTGAVARVAAGFMGSAGGYLTGRSIQGLVVAMTSLAAAAFLLAALFRLRRLPTRRSAALLGIVIGQLIVAGQGYVQIGMVLLSPIFLILLVGYVDRWRLYALRAAQALVTGALIGSIFLVPFLRYYPHFSKMLDQGFEDHQKFRFIVLNLILNDESYYGHGELFDMKPYAGYHSNYLGWAVIIFAAIGGAILWQRSKPTVLVLVLFTVSALWLGTGEPFQRLTGSWAPARLRDFGYSIRNPGWIAMASAPAIIGLAAVGIDSGLRWRLSDLGTASGLPSRAWFRHTATIVVRLATICLLLLGLRNLERGAQQWLAVTKLNQAQVTAMLDAVGTDELAWVSPVLSEWSMQMVAYDHGLKLSDGWRPWDIAGFGATPPTYIAYRYEGEYLPEPMELSGRTDFGLIYHSLQPNQYAVASSGGTCSAQGEGGHLIIACDAPSAGTLTVQESAFSDWTATVNGESVAVSNSNSWISVPIPAGTSTVELRFRPWDFWLGLALTIIGLVAAMVMLLVPARYHIHLRFRGVRHGARNHASGWSFMRRSNTPRVDLGR